MTCPKCKNEMVDVNNGPNLQYFYCRTCKDELKNLLPTFPKEDLFGDKTETPGLTQEEIDEIFSGLDTGSI